MNEADTCYEYVLPKLDAWRSHPHLITEQYAMDAGAIIARGKRKGRRD